MVANTDVTTARHHSNLLTWADTQTDRDTNAQTDVVAPPAPPPLPA